MSVSDRVLCIVVLLDEAATRAATVLGDDAAGAWSTLDLQRHDREKPGEWAIRVTEAVGAACTDDVDLVYVVFDPADPYVARTAWIAAAAAREDFRTIVDVILDDPPCDHESGAHVTLRADAPSAALSMLLTPFRYEAHCDTSMLGARLRAMREDGRVIVCESLTDEPFDRRVRHRVRAVFVQHGSGASFDSWKLEWDFCPEPIGAAVARDSRLAPGTAIIGAIIADRPRPASASFERLHALVESRVAERLPRGALATPYATRIAQELDWFAGNEAEVDAILEASAHVEALLAEGHVVGPQPDRRGGSLIAYLLGLSVFDPVAWQIPFRDFSYPMVLNPYVISTSKRVAPEAPSSSCGVVLRGDPILRDLHGDFPGWLSMMALHDADHSILEELAMALAGSDRRALGDALGAEVRPPSLSCVRTQTANTRGKVRYADQIDSIAADALCITYVEARRLRRGLMKGSAAESRERLVRLAERRMPPDRSSGMVRLIESHAWLHLTRADYLALALKTLAHRRAAAP